MLTDVLTKGSQESGSTINQSTDFVEAVTRKASVTINMLSSVNNTTCQFEQPKQELHKLPNQKSSLNVLQEEREFYSEPERSTTLKQVHDMARPHSDTDITTLSSQEDSDLMLPSNSLQIKGGEKIVIEEPCFESLSLSVSVYDNEEEKVSFYIPDLESPITPQADIPSPLLTLEGPTDVTVTGMIPSRRLLGSSKDLSYHLKNGQSYLFTYLHVILIPLYNFIEYQHNMPPSEIVFPSVKPPVLSGTGGSHGQFPNVRVEYTVSCFVIMIICSYNMR